ncbi:hypothetical protein FKP32DRAFT_1596551 [Trametes sanguinea]|nr:hypothetical protein FKP32DRAFT_1596551 [Trametes sanguinea]
MARSPALPGAWRTTSAGRCGSCRAGVWAGLCYTGAEDANLVVLSAKHSSSRLAPCRVFRAPYMRIASLFSPSSSPFVCFLRTSSPITSRSFPGSDLTRIHPTTSLTSLPFSRPSTQVITRSQSQHG